MALSISRGFERILILDLQSFVFPIVQFFSSRRYINGTHTQKALDSIEFKAFRKVTLFLFVFFIPLLVSIPTIDKV